jgi:hypothetical protein
VAQLSLENAANLREVNATLMTTILAPLESTAVWKALEEGQVYNQAVKGNKGANLGSPHVRIGLKFFQEFCAMPEVQRDPVMKATIEDWWNSEICTPQTTADMLAAEIIVFKIRKPQKPTKQRITAYGAPLETYAKVTMALGTRSQDFLEAFKRYVTEELQWHVKVGPAPKGFNEREVLRLTRPGSFLST